MSKVKSLPPVEYLRECFDYNADTGELRWRQRPIAHFADSRAAAIFNSRCAGKLAGRVDEFGYRIVKLGRPYRAHRLIWKLVTGEEPPESIDHVNGDRDNNRFTKLRSATVPEQGWNRKLKRTNTSGYRGVYRSYGNWQAQIGINGETICLGSFKTKEEASAVYEEAARKLQGEFYREIGKQE